MKQYLEIGKINNTHGIKGELKMIMWCDGIDYIKQLNNVYLDDKGQKSLTLVNARQQKNIAILKFAEITTVEQAEKLKNKVLYCNRDDASIDENAHYLADIIGCKVIDAKTKAEYGVVSDVLNYGASDIYEVKGEEKTALVPAIDDIIESIDTQNQVITITPIKGLFDEN